MNLKATPVIVVILLLAIGAPFSQGKEDGKFSSGSGCSCHYGGSATVSMSGQPTSYTAGQTYSLTVSVTGSMPNNGGGFSLDVDKGTLSAGISISVRVTQTGDSATHQITGNNQRSWSLDWIAPATGSGMATFDVAGLLSNRDGANTGDAWGSTSYQISEFVAANNPPSASNVVLAPADAKTTDPLILTYTYSDPDGDSESNSEITWYRDTQALPQGTISGNTVPVSQTQKGQQWYAEVKPSDGTDFGNVQTSNVVTIANSPPELTEPQISPSSPSESEDLSVTFSSSDADQESLTTEIRWYLDGVLISEFNDDLTIPSIATRDGDQWRVEVTVLDGEDFESRSSQIVTIGSTTQPNNPPVVLTKIITPSQPSSEDTLILTYTTEDSDGDQILSTEIQWSVDGVQWGSGDEIEATSTQKGQVWNASVRVSDGMNWSELAYVEVTIGNTPPVVDSVIISPTQAFTTNDLVVNYTSSDIDGDEQNTPLIQWLKNDIEQVSLSNSLSVPSSLTSKGEIWKVIVSANDGDNFSVDSMQASVEILNSLPTVTIENLPSNLTFADNDVLGLQINPLFVDLDDDAITYQITWLRNGFRDGTLDNSSFVPADYFGAGQTWSLSISLDDGESSSQTFEWSILVDNLKPEAMIKVDSDNIWSGEIIILNGSESTDLDGVIVNHHWDWQDSSGQSGVVEGDIVEIIANGLITVTLTVEDELGQSSEVVQTIQTTTGPKITTLVAENKGMNVELNWQWDGPEATFYILRNGLKVGESIDTSFVDVPIIAGSTNYTAIPVIDQQGLIQGSMTITNFDVDVTTDSASGLSETGGFLIGILFLFISIAVASVGLIQRGDVD